MPTTTISGNTPYREILDVGNVMTVVISAGGSAGVRLGAPSGAVDNRTLAASTNTKFGPYLQSREVHIGVSAGSATITEDAYELAPTQQHPSAAEFAALPLATRQSMAGMTIYSSASPYSVLGVVDGGGDLRPIVNSATTLIDLGAIKAGIGTLICDWTASLSGTPSSSDAPPEPGYPTGVLAVVSAAQTSTYCSANAGSQSSAMACAGLWAKAATRADLQAGNVFYLEFGTDNTFANICFVSFTVRCDGKWRFLVLPSQAAWGTSGTFTIGSTAFTHVRIRESASLCTSAGRDALTSGEAVQFGNVYRNPSAKPFAYVRLDDCLADQYTARLTLATDFVGLSGVTIPSGVAQSALSLVNAFGLKATCYVLTRHIGDTAAGFMTASQLRALQDSYGWDIAFQTHANPLDLLNRGARLLGPLGYAIRAIGAISSVDASANTITCNSVHNITNTSGVAGLQGYPVQFIGADLPAPLDTSTKYWLSVSSTTAFRCHLSEADSCNGINPIDLTTAGVAANFGYRFWGSTNDSTAIAADFVTGQVLMQEYGFSAWRHYAPNQGAFDLYTEPPILALMAAGRLLTTSATLANTGIAANSFVPRVAIGHVAAGIGSVSSNVQAVSLLQWVNLPVNVDTHNGGVDLQTTIRAYVDALIARGAIGGNYHHHFSNEASMRNFCAYLDQIKLRVDQGVLSTGTVGELYARLQASGVET